MSKQASERRNRTGCPLKQGLEQGSDMEHLGRAVRAGPLGRLAVAGLLVAAAGACASGSGGSGSPDGDTAPLPDQRRNVMRIAGYRPMEIYNEAGIGVRTIDMAAETVWSVVGGVYAQLEIPVEQSDPRAMQIGNQGYSARRIERDRMNTFVDCGSNLAGPMANQYDITLAVMTRLTSKGPESTEILTMVDAYGRPRAVSGNPIHCQSRGVLEQRVAQRIAEALGKGS